MARTAEEHLAHYGIKGMRWGYRRNESGGYSRSGQRTKASEDYESSRTLLKEKSKTLSNDEIRKVNERLQLEKTLKELTSNSSTMKSITKGNKQAKDILDVGNTVNQAMNFVNSPTGKLLKDQLMKK